jgi:hypothetical protein
LVPFDQTRWAVLRTALRVFYGVLFLEHFVRTETTNYRFRGPLSERAKMLITVIRVKTTQTTPIDNLESPCLGLLSPSDSKRVTF